MRPIAQAGFRAVAVDQRGYSPEARPQEVKDYAIEQLISDVQGFVNALGCRRFHLVGHDWGALLAWEFAAKHPDRLQSLSALSTPHRSEEHTSELQSRGHLVCRLLLEKKKK